MVDIILVDTSSLLGHEEVIESNLNSRLVKLKSKGFYKPIIVDSSSLVILDGHHKWTAAKEIGLSRVPVVIVDYLDDESISVDVWPDSGRSSIKKHEVIEMGLSEGLFPPKTSKHTFGFNIPSIRIPLEELLS